MAKLFGTDGIRGIANRNLTASLSFRVGASLTYVLKSNGIKKPTIFIGKDTRLSGYVLEDAISSGILAAGGDVKMVKVVPTPAVAYLTKKHKVDAGIMISASHNSFEYNGIKIFSSEGYKFSDDIEEQIENIIISYDDSHLNTEPHLLGKRYNIYEQVVPEYIDFLVSSVQKEIKNIKTKPKIVIDTANGSASLIVPKVFDRLGLEFHQIGFHPNGININENIGSTHPEKLISEVIRRNADIGFAYDGDADRLICVDNKGRIVDGDTMMFLLGRYLKEKKSLAQNTIVTTVMSNFALAKKLEEIGIKSVQTDVGDKYVIEEMLKNDYNFGGEQSGHLIFKDENTTGDGIFASLKMLVLILSSDKTFSELSDEYVPYPQTLFNAKIKEEKKVLFKNADFINEKKLEIEKKLDGKGRVLIRPSGTEPVIRVMIEGEDENFIKNEALNLTRLIEEKFN